MIDASHKIVIIIPYFGSWPSYFNIFLKGCQHNNWLDILFFTDCPLPKKKPRNVRFIETSLNRLSSLITEKIGVETIITKPYKLCDFRPCYGLIFEDFLKDYNYWGYGDIDLIYGDLKPSIINRINEGFDVLSSREEILSGSLSVFKNTPFINNLFKSSKEYIHLLNSDKHYGLDETANSDLTWQGGSKLDLAHHCFTYLIAYEALKKTLKVSFVTICKEHLGSSEIISYQNGILKIEETSLAYYHYVGNKNSSGYKLANWNNVPDCFFITETGFYKNDQFYWFIHYYRKISGFIFNLPKRVWKRLIRN